MVKRILISCLTVIFFVACGPSSGGGDGDNPEDKPSTGQFKDSNTAGLSYSATSYSGTTNEIGQYSYKAGEQVTFSVGGVILGTVAGNAVTTPVNLITNGNASIIAVVNIVRFLMLLDDDANPDNGINISAAVQASAAQWNQIDFMTADLSTDLNQEIIPALGLITGETHILADTNTAETHLKETLRCSYAGAYVGTINGDQSGFFGFLNEAQTGFVRGKAYFPDNLPGNRYATVEGDSSMDYDQNVSFLSKSTFESGTSFTGSFPNTNSISGLWHAGFGIQTGEFSGNRVGGSSTAKYRFTGVFTGGLNGLLTFDIDNAGQVTGIAYSLENNHQSTASGSVTGTTLNVTTSDGVTATATLNVSTGNLTDGIWQVPDTPLSGTFEGDGCKLN